ncbi:hypothetical protein Tco_1009836 [Tanacetum coccineum]
MGTPTLVCVWFCPNFTASTGRLFWCVSDIWLFISGDAKFPPLLGCDKDEIQAIVAEKPKVQKRRRIANGGSGSNHPPKKLREDNDTSGHVGANTNGKSIAAI